MTALFALIAGAALGFGLSGLFDILGWNPLMSLWISCPAALYIGWKTPDWFER